MIEYKTVIVEGWPDAILNAQVVEGWKLVSVTNGGFDRAGKHYPAARTLWLERKRKIPGEKE